MFRYRLILSAIMAVVSPGVDGAEPEPKPPSAALKELGDQPGAKEFLAVAGESEASIKLFRDILASPNRAMLEQLGKPRELAIAISARKDTVFAGLSNRHLQGIAPRPAQAPPNPAPVPNPPATIVDIAAIYFAESTLTDKQVGERPTYETTTRLSLPVLAASFRDGPEREAVAKILARWVGTRNESATLFYSLTPLATLKPELGIATSSRILGIEQATPFHRSMAITTIVRSGGEQRPALLLPLLSDDTRLYEDTDTPMGGNQHEIRTRDAALAALLVITKQNVEDYGFTLRPTTKELMAHLGAAWDIQRYSTIHYYFDGDDKAAKREAAFKKWDAWYAMNKGTFKK